MLFFTWQYASFIPGTQGFGIGAYSGTLPAGMTALTGSADPTSANYGNYTYSDGSIMCYIPRFYYRIGSVSSDRFATYGANAIDIVRRAKERNVPITAEASPHHFTFIDT